MIRKWLISTLRSAVWLLISRWRNSVKYLEPLIGCLPWCPQSKTMICWPKCCPSVSGAMEMWIWLRVLNGEMKCYIVCWRVLCCWVMTIESWARVVKVLVRYLLQNRVYVVNVFNILCLAHSFFWLYQWTMTIMTVC